MNRRKLAALMADLLNAQTEEEPRPAAAPEVWAQAILGRHPLTPLQEKALWTSPAARADYLELRRAALTPARDAWRSSGSGKVVFLRAAASDTREQVLEGKGWKLAITPLPGAWILTVRLEPEAAALLPEGAQLRLIDDEGLVWGEGRLDGDRAFDLEWSDEESPLERLRRTGLRLEIG